MSREVRLIHTADSHIGYKQYHSDVRRQDFLDAFSVVIDDAIDMGVDAVVHAGDLFDSRSPTLDDILDTMNILSRLKGAGIPFLSIVGNHESKQSTQWLDLFQRMGVATRLGASPCMIGDVALYGIDSVPKSKIPGFDYSIFNASDSGCNVLVMHQLMSPFPFGEWDCEEVIDRLPFDVHAILLGDYHKYEKMKVKDAWVTYCGSSERNSASEREERSYNIVTINGSEMDISRRRIPTREFVFIPVTLNEGYEDIFAPIKEHDIEDKVVFVDIAGSPEVSVSYSEIEEFLLSRGALIPRVRDMRTGEQNLEDNPLKMSFTDPDEAVKKEIRKMDLTTGGILIDEVVRDSVIVKTKVDMEIETRIAKMMEDMDFTQPLQEMRVAVGDVEGFEEEDVPDLIEEYEKNAPEQLESGQEPVREMEVDRVEIDSPAEDDKEPVKEDHPVLPEKEEIKTENMDENIDTGGPDVEPEEPKKNIHVPKQYNLGDYL